MAARSEVPAWSKTVCWATLLGYWAFMIYETHAPVPLGPGPTIPHLDKALHCLSFGLLGGALTLARSLAFWGDAAAWRASRIRMQVVNWSAVAAFGLLDEATQPLTGRSLDPIDWLADALGAACGVWSAAWLVSLRSRRWSPFTPAK